MLGKDGMQRLSRQMPGLHHGLGFRAVHDLPTFTDRLAGRQGAAKGGLEGPATPDAFLVKRLKTQ